MFNLLLLFLIKLVMVLCPYLHVFFLLSTTTISVGMSKHAMKDWILTPMWDLLLALLLIFLLWVRNMITLTLMHLIAIFMHQGHNTKSSKTFFIKAHQLVNMKLTFSNFLQFQTKRQHKYSICSDKWEPRVTYWYLKESRTWCITKARWYKYLKNHPTLKRNRRKQQGK